MSDVVADATISAQTLLVLANSALTFVAGYFIREFVRDVRRLTNKVTSLDKNLALLAQHVRYDIDNFTDAEGDIE